MISFNSVKKQNYNKVKGDFKKVKVGCYVELEITVADHVKIDPKDFLDVKLSKSYFQTARKKKVVKKGKIADVVKERKILS